MSFKRLLLLVMFFFSVSLFIPNISKAASLQESLTSENSIFVKIQEGVQYFFAFGVGKKIGVLEKQAEKRLAMAQGYAEKGNGERVQNLMQSYLQIKERQNSLLDKNDNNDVLSQVEDRTIEQQKTMEEIKNIIIDDMGKQGVIDVQEQVVNQVAQRIVVQNGTEGQTEFLNEVLHVWAPGTGPGGEAGTVYAGGGKLIYAPGTGPGGGEAGVVIVGGQMMFAPGTSAGGSGGTNVVEGGGINVVEGGGSSGGGTTTNTVDGGGQNVDSGTTSDSKTWIDP
jgi:hypothetical protein